jgi:membrane associated rhomboid family serine protease
VSSFATPTSAEGGVAVWAHVGGFIAGAILIFFFKRRWIEVLERPKTAAFHIEHRRGPWG